MLRCFNTICLFPCHDTCLRSYTEINASGMCDDIENVPLSPELLRELKRGAVYDGYYPNEEWPDNK